jgi:hypothetical protein
LAPGYISVARKHVNRKDVKVGNWEHNSVPPAWRELQQQIGAEQIHIPGDFPDTSTTAFDPVYMTKLYDQSEESTAPLGALITSRS